MPLLSKLSSFWRNLLHKTQIEQDLDEEARSYIEMLTDEKVKAGATPQEARRAALIEFGGLDQVKEQVRDVRVGAFLEILWYDTRHAARSLAKNPGFAAVAVLTTRSWHWWHPRDLQRDLRRAAESLALCGQRPFGGAGCS